LAGLRVVNRLRVPYRRLADHVRALSERATHGVLSKTLRQQLQLSLDLGKSAHVYVKLHRAPPCPRAGRPILGRPRSARGRWSCASVPRVSSIRGAWLGVAPPSCGSPGVIGGSHADRIPPETPPSPQRAEQASPRVGASPRRRRAAPQAG